MISEKIKTTEAIEVQYMTPENTKFERRGDFLSVTTTVPDDEGNTNERKLNKVYFHRSFPFDMLTEFISVLDEENNEIGLIRSVYDFDEATAQMILEELEKKYFAPIILRIKSVKERFGYSIWNVDTNVGNLKFSVRDTYRSIIWAGNNRAFIVDVDSNRYEIPDITKLDKKSFKHIELYT